MKQVFIEYNTQSNEHRIVGAIVENGEVVIIEVIMESTDKQVLHDEFFGEFPDYSDAEVIDRT